jgi:hypothetical protein
MSMTLLFFSAEHSTILVWSIWLFLSTRRHWPSSFSCLFLVSLASEFFLILLQIQSEAFTCRFTIWNCTQSGHHLPRLWVSVQWLSFVLFRVQSSCFRLCFFRRAIELAKRLYEQYCEIWKRDFS